MKTARKQKRLTSLIAADCFMIRPTPYNGYIQYNREGYWGGNETVGKAEKVEKFQATPYAKVSLADMQARVANEQSIFGDE